MELLGITGKMALEDDQVIVPTRTGLSSFCLSDGTQLLDVDTQNIGWRNGVTMTEEGMYTATSKAICMKSTGMAMFQLCSLAEEEFDMLT